MPQIGPLEILIVAVLALLVFGPEKLPEIGRSVGKGLTQIKRMASEVKSEFDVSLEDDPEVKPEPQPAKSVAKAPKPAASVDEPESSHDATRTKAAV